MFHLVTAQVPARNLHEVALVFQAWNASAAILAATVPDEASDSIPASLETGCSDILNGRVFNLGAGLNTEYIRGPIPERPDAFARFFMATASFLDKYHKLSPAQQKLVRTACETFKVRPFDPRLGTHEIKSLSPRVTNLLSDGHPSNIASFSLGDDLRAIFVVHRNAVTLIDFGNYPIYR